MLSKYLLSEWSVKKGLEGLQQKVGVGEYVTGPIATLFYFVFNMLMFKGKVNSRISRANSTDYFLTATAPPGSSESAFNMTPR